jgi:predicted type IV restriction endonuclease
MDFIDQIKALAAKITELLPYINNEAQTRSALVEPFIEILGYNPRNPLEVQPEYTANVKVPGVKQDEKIDYALMQDNKPIILIECKHHNVDPQKGYDQLFKYFAALESRIGIITNGIIYKFYADLEAPNKLDEKPFLEIDLLNLNEGVIGELKKLSKQSFDLDDVLSTANELKYTKGIISILREQLNSPSDDFVRVFFTNLRPGKTFTGKAKEEFISLTQRSMKLFIKEQIQGLIEEINNPPKGSENNGTLDDPPSSVINDKKIVTTEEEMEGFYIIKAIVSEIVNPSRISHRDTVSYFGILLDDNNRKPICRLHFNSSNNKKLGLFDHGEDGKQEEKIKITDINEIYTYRDRIQATVKGYLEQEKG